MEWLVLVFTSPATLSSSTVVEPPASKRARELPSSVTTEEASDR